MGAAGALTLLLLQLASGWAAASLMAIDLGSEFFKVCLVKPGRTPISIVVNEMSKRKTPALVGVVGKDRLIGEEAYSFGVRYPETIFQRARDILGKLPNDPTAARMLQDHHLPHEVVPYPNRTAVAAYKVSEDQVLGAEELVASLFQYARDIAEAQAGSPVLDTVIAVPAFFGQYQRQALIDAAELAGLKVMGLINTHTAAALQYGIERDFTNKTQTIILYDMGSSSTEVALVRYSTYTVKEAGKPKVYNQLEVKDVDWDSELGSNNLDSAMIKHFAKAFHDKYKVQGTVLGNPKSVAKMRRQVRRTKEMLSANTAAPMSVEELHDGKDFQSHITREEFEALAGDFWERAAAPLKRLIERNNLKPEDIDAVELLGGGSRVPRVQAALSQALNGRPLDKHLDADEAVVLGAGLFAANLSTSFRLRKFGMVDTSTYGVVLNIDELKVAEVAEAPAADEAAKSQRNLLPYMKKLPIKRVVHFTNVTADPIKISLAYNASTPHGLPPGVAEPGLAQLEITGVESVIARYNTSGQVNLRFEADIGGLLRFVNVEAVVEYEVMEEKIVVETVAANTTANATTAGAANSTTGAAGSETSTEEKEKAEEASGKQDDMEDEPSGDEQQAEGDKAEEGAQGEEGSKESSEGKAAEGAKDATNTTASGNATTTEGAKNATTVKRVMVPKRKLAKVTLNVSGGWRYDFLGGASLDAAKATLKAWVEAETIKRENARTKNELESYIIKTREALETDSLLQKVTTDDQRIKFGEQLAEAEDWLYMEGDAETAVEYRKRLKALKDVGEPMFKRAQEAELRPQAVERVQASLDLKYKVANAWADTKPWINANETEDVIKKLDEFKVAFEAMLAEQAKKDDHDDPAFTVDKLFATFDKVDRFFSKVNNKKQPKPPPAPPAANNGTTNGTEGAPGNGTDASSGQGNEQAGKEDKQPEGGAKQQEDKEKSEGKKQDTKKEGKEEKESGKGKERDAGKGKEKSAGKGKEKDAGKGKEKSKSDAGKAKGDKSKGKDRSKEKSSKGKGKAEL